MELYSEREHKRRLKEWNSEQADLPLGLLLIVLIRFALRVFHSGVPSKPNQMSGQMPTPADQAALMRSSLKPSRSQLEYRRT